MLACEAASMRVVACVVRGGFVVRSMVRLWCIPGERCCQAPCVPAVLMCVLPSISLSPAGRP